MSTANKEKAPGVYFRVGSKNGPLVIGGAKKKMEEDPTFTYVPLYMKAAPLAEIESWLDEKHPKKKKEALKGCYNLENLKRPKISDAFTREIENAEEERRLVNEEKKNSLNTNLDVLGRLVSLHREQKKNEKDDPSLTKTSKRTTSLKDKVKALKGEGVVLDVTNMNENGTKALKVKWSGKSSKRRLSSDKSDRFYYVVYNSENEHAPEGVRNFLENYGGFSESQINGVVETIEEGNQPNFSKGRSPGRRSPPLLSPSSRKKKSGGKKAKRSKAKESEEEEEVSEEEPEVQPKKSKAKKGKSRKVMSPQPSEDEDSDGIFEGVSDGE